MPDFNLESYLSLGVKEIVQGIIKTSLKNPKASLFMMKFLKASQKAEKIRQNAEESGEHIPPFLIASIADTCNLHCAGCYARANQQCGDDGSKPVKKTLSTDKWQQIFKESGDLGISFILLAGGEPFVRKDILTIAAKEKRIIFPIFTNGTMIDTEYLSFLEKNCNLIPIISIEGNKEATDLRRGTGVYQIITDSMAQLDHKGILFGASVTIQKSNRDEVLSEEFTKKLKNLGCKAVIYVEYVPMDKESQDQAFDDKDREIMEERLTTLRTKESEMIFIAFPGDEKSSGGCLAAGRGFFHINPYGAAEPCPFSPYSDTSLIETTLREALQSPLFLKLQKNGNLETQHIGGCVLFEQQDQVKLLLEGEKE